MIAREQLGIKPEFTGFPKKIKVKQCLDFGTSRLGSGTVGQDIVINCDPDQAPDIATEKVKEVVVETVL